MLREETPGQSILYCYEPGSYAPLARLDQAEGEEQKVYYFHTDQIGTPLEMSNSEGEIVWQATYRSWGAIEQLTINEVEQNLRFQGQYFDYDTGLHYNTFRYYDPESGRFTTQDPIGVSGGFNLYHYAPNPCIWMDPWGWCGELSGKARQVHDLAGGGDARAIRNSTVSIVEANVNGKPQLFAAGSGGRLSPAQRELLQELGVPKENIFNGRAFVKDFERLENHAERIILRNLPENSVVSRWGVSWGGLQRNASCASCQPHVDIAGGIFD